MGKLNKKVYVGLSGGVDSSVSAALLKDRGYDVTGVFIKIWHPDFLNCDWKSEMRDAMRICAKLNISFRMLDLSKEYEKEVLKHTIEEYKKGRTPNPDVMCNKFIKFGYFFDFAMKDGADFVATGHYAQIEKRNSRFSLIKSIDLEKDQTYFLWTLQQKHLSKTLFPIGNLKKEKVRKLAKKYRLFTFQKKDSQGLCFVGHIDMKSFLKKYIKTEEGDVLNEKSEIIGKHHGSILYTIGERHGFTINKKTTSEKPYYVISKNIDANTITVSQKKLGKNFPSIIKISSLNIINKIKTPLTVEARVRYRQNLQKAVLDTSKSEIRFQKPTEMVSEGQSVVFYLKNECIGGGIIDLP